MEGQPKYLKIVHWIKSRVEGGELAENDRLESECEIAQIFGVSRQTVRHALGVLDEEGLTRSVKGSGTYIRLRKTHVKLSKTVTIISTYIESYIFPRILREMVKTLEENGYESRIIYTENRLEQERRTLLKMMENLKSGNSMDPLIVEPVMSGLPNPNIELYRELKEAGAPILFFNSRYPQLDVPYIAMDDVMAGKLAADHLIQCGHRKIGGIFKLDDRQGMLRYQGMQESLIRAGIGPDQDHLVWLDTRELRQGLRDCERLWQRLKECSACICYNDEVAHMLTEQMTERGLSIPDDLSVASIDNSALARLNAVPLTSVSHPMEKLGRKTVEELLRMIRFGSSNVKDYLFLPELQERRSVKRIGDPIEN